MTLEEAYEVLGVSEDADTKAIKRAYHRLLKRHKPDRDPEGFRRLRDAFEAATEFASMRAFVADVDAAEPPEHAPRPEPPRPTAPAEVDPMVVFGALERGELQWAHQLVMDDRWAGALLDEGSGPLHWATRDVGLAVVLVHKPAFDALVTKYPDVFEAGDPQLAYLQRVSPEWHWIRPKLPRALVEFATRLPVTKDEEGSRRLAARVGGWFARDVARGLRLADAIDDSCYTVGSFLRGLTDDFEDAVPRSEAARHPAETLRTLTLPFVLAAIIAGVFAFVAGVGLSMTWGTLIGTAFAAAVVAGVLYCEQVVFEAVPQLRLRYLLACIDADMDPSLAALSLRAHPFVRRSLERDVGLDLAFRLTRLARLEVR